MIDSNPSSNNVSVKMKLERAQTPEDFGALLRSDYLSSLGITDVPSYRSGLNVRVVPPKQTTRHGVMVLGAYPTAVFKRTDGHLVPWNDIEEPFDPRTASGKELDEHYLDKVGIARTQCWITNLLKVFLFKPDHAGSNVGGAESLSRDKFEVLALSQTNIDWMSAELGIASPRVIITLGREVAGIVRGVKDDDERNCLLGGSIKEFSFAGKNYRWIHLPHPGIVMRGGSEKNTWPERHEEFCAQVRASIRDLVG
jgi:hypothetical protein